MPSVALDIAPSRERSDRTTRATGIGPAGGNDVLRLSQLLAPATRIPLVKTIGDEMTRFLTVVASDNSIDPKALQLGNGTFAELVARIA